MSRASILVYAVILCCTASTSFGAYDRGNSRRSASNYAPQQPTDNSNLYTHRSPVCLIHQLAQKNNITIEYELVNDGPPTQMPAGASTTPRPRSFGFRLHLGTEIYRATASTKIKAKDKVSREAYDKTKYPKPTLKERTCVENGTRTIVSILYEFAAVNGTTILDKEIQLEGSPSKFRVELTLNRLSAWGEGFSKKSAKKEAAAKLVTMFGKDFVLHEITKKFNDPEYIVKGPIERLNSILYARAEPPAIYEVEDEVSDIGGRTILSKVLTVTGDSVGSGLTIDESRIDAANNLLKAMGFKL